MPMLRIALAQVEQTDDMDRNRARIFEYLEKAVSEGVQILCFPEAQTAGYRVDVTAADAPVQVDRLEAIHEEVASYCGRHGMACILGTEMPLESDPRDGKPYNSALVISEHGQVLGVHHKSKLTPMDALAYTPGTEVANYELFGVKVGLVICFEGFRFAETTECCVRHGAQLVFHPQNNTTRPHDWKIPVHHAMMITRAAENTVWFASCNCAHVPHQNCETRIIAPNGVIHARCDMKEEALVVGDIDIDEATRAMCEFDRAESNDLIQQLGPTRLNR
ncbi:MAG: hypothetical protein CMJ18_16175 [Phycisphaeraceae bacterium]|nr:hypothetical protein [Phycisphaeraceae bacterium]